MSSPTTACARRYRWHVDAGIGAACRLRTEVGPAHQSLQECLLSQLVEQARRPTLNEVLDRVGGRAGGSVTTRAAVEALKAGRARR